MTKRSWPGGRNRFFFLPCLALLLLGSLGCEDNSQRPVTKPAGKVRRIVSSRRDLTVSPPEISARVSKVKTHWGDGQQLFALTLTNTGDKEETVHAIVYATNEKTNPPRRAISPPTAYQWFELARSKDGRLTADDIQKSWKNNVFVSARGGKLPFSWKVVLKPGETQTVDAAHNLDDRSPHPATKGKKLSRVGFLEYQIWLFTADGQCFSEEVIPAQSPPPEERPSTKKTPPTTRKETLPPIETKREDESTKALRLARYYLDNSKPDKARAKLQMILSKYPSSLAAVEAKKLLAKVPEE